MGTRNQQSFLTTRQINDMTNKINCPNCGTEISVEEILHHRIYESVQKDFTEKINAENNKLKKQKEELLAEKERMERFKENEKEIFNKKIEEEKQKIKAEELEKAKQASRTEVEELKKLIEQKQEENEQLQKLKVSLFEKEQQIKEIKSTSELELQKRILDFREQHGEELRKKIEEEQFVKYREQEQKIEQQKKLIEEMKRKMEQGSMQTQGEVLELELETMLTQQFPFDKIEEVKKGVKGADCIQTVFNEFQQPCGQIIFESKNTTAFTQEWIEKLKADMRAQGADIAVLVTRTMPKDMQRFGLKDGVWICHYSEAKSVVTILRQQLIAVYRALESQENKGDKMHMLYDYLTGKEFKMQIEAIAEGFISMKQGLDSERRAMEKQWKEREKQIEKVLLNTTHLYGSIKGIAGNAIGSVSSLELNTGEE